VKASQRKARTAVGVGEQAMEYVLHIYRYPVFMLHTSTSQLLLYIWLKRKENVF